MRECYLQQDHRRTIEFVRTEYVFPAVLATVLQRDEYLTPCHHYI